MNSKLQILLGAAIASAAVIVACAQTAPPPSSSPRPPARSENGEVVTLEEFAVSTTATNDYLSSESITGTRIVSKLRDLPFNVNVVTSDFIEDFAAFELKDQFAYVSSFSPSEAQGEYQLRGFVASNQLRNGFRRLGLIDKVNVDRAEVIKGPAASIYGKIQPGGVINILTKKPRSTPQQSLSFAAGSNDFWRAQGSSTGPIGQSKQFFYRQDLAATGRNYEMPFKENEQWTTSTQLLWKPAANTSLNFEIEYLWRHERRGNAVPPYIVLNVPDPFRVPSQNRVYNRWARLATEIANFNHQGPKEYNNREVFTLTGTFEHRINSHWSARVGANWFDRSFDRINISGDAYRPEFNAIANGSTANPGPRIPVWRPIDEGSTSVQADLLGSFTTGALDHKLLFTVDYNRTTEDAYEARMTSAIAALPGSISPRLSVTNPDYNFISFIDNRTLYTDERENLRSTVDNWGLFVSERAALFEGRLIGLAGVRLDTVENDVNDRLLRQTLKYRLDDTTWQLGLNFRVTRDVTLFANTSTTFLPQARFNIDGTPLPNETGEGAEGGIKIVAFHERFALTATYYDISRNNIARETSNPVTGDRVVILSGKEKAQGFEIDANAQLTESFQFLGGYGYADAVTASNDEFPFLINTTPRRVPRHTFGAAARYELRTGPLRGIYVTFGTQYASSSVVNPGSGRTITASTGNPIVNNPMPNGRLPFPNQPPGAVLTVGSVRVGDGREALKNAAYQIYDASIGYRWRTGARKVSHKIQLNAKNLTDKFYTWGSAAQGDPFTLIGTYSLTF
jgi:outer membrane receptor protein involved in Fe transport